MSFLDNLSNLNPFKKKDDFALPPLNEGHNQDFAPHNFEQGPGLDMGQPNLEHGPNFSPDFSANPPNSQMPMDDHRMTMPLGDTIRQTKISAMYGNEDAPVRERERDHNPLQKDLELISSKLDYLKASLDAINQRLVNLEHLTKQEIENKRW